MWTAYLFTVLALVALPDAMKQGTYVVLLPIIIVGQNRTRRFQPSLSAYSRLHQGLQPNRGRGRHRSRVDTALGVHDGTN